MAADERELDDLLSQIDREIDEEHIRRVDVRCRRSLTWQSVDRPPLVVQSSLGKPWQLPPPWNRFRVYPHRQAFADRVAMMQNQLLDRVVPGLILRDDSPLAIRSDHGTIQVASALGGRWRQLEDNPPWVEPFGGEEPIRELAEHGAFSAERGVVPHSTDTLRFYHHKLAAHPRAGQWIQIAMPDLQGPMDIAEQLWGSEIMPAMLEQPQLVQQVLEAIAGAMIRAIEHYRPLTRERPMGFPTTTQHGYQIPGQLLIRNDSSILISPETYARVVRPYDQHVLEAVGGGSIHFCGNGMHLVQPMLEIQALKGLDLGQSFMVDLPAVYAACGTRGVAITHVMPGRAELVSGEAARLYPTGVVFAYTTQDIDDARQVIAAYHSRASRAA